MKASYWVTRNLKTGLNLEHFPVKLDDTPNVVMAVGFAIKTNYKVRVEIRGVYEISLRVGQDHSFKIGNYCKRGP